LIIGEKVFRKFKKDEFEKKLEEIGKRLRIRAKVEERLTAIEQRVGVIEMRVKTFKPPLKEELESLRADVRKVEDQVEQRVKGLKSDLSAKIKKEVIEGVRADVESLVLEGVKRGEDRLARRIGSLTKKVSTIESKLDKLVETLEAVA
jgi:hypothetical protein